MHKTKLIQIFYTLSKAELRKLHRFVKSPVHNTRDDVIRFFEYLQKTSPEQYKKLQKKIIFKSIYPKEVYDEKKMYYLISFLMKVLEDFLIYTERTENGAENLLALAKAFRRLELEEQFNQTIRKINTNQEKQPLRDMEYFQYQYQLQLEICNFFVRKTRDTSSYLQALDHSLDLQFIVQKLRQGCAIIVNKTIYTGDYDTGLLSSVIEYVKHNPKVLEHPAVALYYYYYQAATDQENSRDYFNKFKEVLLAHHHQFNEDEAYGYYGLAINYCIKQINIGKEAYLAVLFELYQIGLDTKLLFVKGKLHHFAFKNIAALALRLKKFDWVRDFIQNYQEALNEKVRDTYVHFAKSKLAFEIGNYDEALKRLAQMEYDDLLLNLAAKIMLLKIYYEQKDYKVLDSLISSFRTFINRKKELAYSRDNYKNTLRLVQKLVNVNPYSKEDKNKLRQEILSEKRMLERTWILEQLDKIN